MTLSELCRELNNWFETARYIGTFTISDGTLNLTNKVQEGQYFRVVGSVFNDGVYQYPAHGLTDETFKGAIWPMALPIEITSLKDEIDEWEGTNADANASPYQSESFGGYSYTIKSGNSGSTADTGTWQNAFSSRLSKWRKARLV